MKMPQIRKQYVTFGFMGLFAACTSSPQPLSDGFTHELTLFTYGGFEFAGIIQGDELLVRVPCCQTYDADDAFKALMLEAIEQKLGCTPANPEFTDGWTGPWQLRTPFACFNGGALDVILLTDGTVRDRSYG